MTAAEEPDRSKVSKGTKAAQTRSGSSKGSSQGTSKGSSQGTSKGRSTGSSGPEKEAGTTSKRSAAQGRSPRRSGRGDALAAGAARASGERRRRSGTPLLSVEPVEVSTARRRAQQSGPAKDEVVPAVEQPADQPLVQPVEPVVIATEALATNVPATEAPSAEAPKETAPAAEPPKAPPDEAPAAKAPAAEPPKASSDSAAPDTTVPDKTEPDKTEPDKTGTASSEAPDAGAAGGDGPDGGPAQPADDGAEARKPARPSRAAIRSKRRATGHDEPARLRAVPPVQEGERPATDESDRAGRHTASAGAPQADDGDRRSAGERLVSAVVEAAEFSSEARPGPAELVELAVNVLRVAATSAGVPAEDVERQVAETLAYLRRRLSGDYVVDEFGFDEDYTIHVHLPLLRPLYKRWFRVDVRGIENIPTVGGALVVGNHSGTVAMDSLMTQVAVYDEHPANRHLRMLGADLVFQMPFIGTMARRSGSTLAASTDAERLLRSGELVGVWPEGFKGVGKPFSERYKLQRFGRGGFVSAALRAGAPIVPVSIVGAEEIYPMIGNMPTVARLLGVPYAPITPTFPWLGPLGIIPLPSKWLIEFGPPIETTSFGPEAADDPMLVFDLTDQVRETIQQTLYSLLMQRKSVFL